MESVAKRHKSTFRVLDSQEAPYGGWFLKMRLDAGDAPTIRELRGAILSASSPDGEASFEVKVHGFPVFAGHPSDDRLRRTGRVDIHVTVLDGSTQTNGPQQIIGPKWRVSGPSR